MSANEELYGAGTFLKFNNNNSVMSQLLPTVATIQASTSHVYFQTNITLELDFLNGKRIK